MSDGGTGQGDDVQAEDTEGGEMIQPIPPNQQLLPLQVEAQFWQGGGLPSDDTCPECLGDFAVADSISERGNEKAVLGGCVWLW